MNAVVGQAISAARTIVEPSPVDEVREVRRLIVAGHGGDVGRLCADLRDLEREFLGREGRFANLVDSPCEASRFERVGGSAAD